MTDDKLKLFRAQRDVSSTVEREKITDERSDVGNRRLDELGQWLNPISGMKYMGSAAVHVYWNDTLGHCAFITQASGLRSHECPEPLAQSAMTDLMGTTMEMYGHKRPRKRSGF